MNRSKLLLSWFLFLIFAPILFSQNYLRVSDPDAWGIPPSVEPGWQDYMFHGQLDEVTIIAEPQGIFTEIGFYATISQGPDVWSWQEEYEIIWQFELPKNAIVHDSWLWVDEDIIKADVVDYWTALTTYEDIVDRNEDPSFFYQLPDNRYEIRIYPLPEGGARRIKMSFLIPAVWDLESVSSDLLQALLQSTDYLPSGVEIGMPVSDRWQSPVLGIDNELSPFTDTVTGGSGNVLHYKLLSAQWFATSENPRLIVEAPLSPNRTFLSTYSDAGENFYQLAFVPDWGTVTQPEPKQSLLLLDYDDFKTSLSKETFLFTLQSVLADHLGEGDAVNAAVTTSGGIRLLSDTWLDYDAALFADTLAGLLNVLDNSNLEQLLTEGFAWAKDQGDASHIHLLAANDEFVYPPLAEEVFANLESLLPAEVSLSILDYQDQNVSVIFYEDEAYEGNTFFYQLLSEAFSESEILVYRNSSEDYEALLTGLFPVLNSLAGIMDYTTSLETGIAFQRYSLSSAELNPENQGVILQTGKYLGNFPMHISANLITGDGQFWNISSTVEAAEILTGDTLMREMWFGPYLKELEAQAGTDEDRYHIIEQSINERVLTGLTAFLALEPEEGGEPCIGCLYNDGDIFIATEEVFNSSEAELVITPNPAKEVAVIRLVYADALTPSDWTATVYDSSGRPLSELDLTSITENCLEWQWRIGKATGAGIYFCKVRSSYGELTGKIVVLPE